jgi:putative addiction module component (TIGR02574 family)
MMKINRIPETIAMPTTVQKPKDQLKKLPFPQRAEIASFLIESLDQEDEGWEAAWDKELARRVKEIKAGRARGIPADDVFAKLREKYR